MRIATRQRALRHIRALRGAAARHKCDARTTVGTLLGCWVKDRFPLLRPPSLPRSTKLERTQALLAFQEFLRQRPLLEACYWLSTAYAVLAGPEYRHELAMFFTPPSLTKGLLKDLEDQGADFARHTFFDPACGGAAFLAPVAQKIFASLSGRRSYKNRLKHLEGHLRGAELDTTLCALSRTFLQMALYEPIVKGKYVPKFDIVKCDSLRRAVSRVDVVICNPPYRKLTRKQVDRVRARYSDVIDGQPNLYGLFIRHCVRSVRRAGYVALVTPTSFLSGQHFGKLREVLGRNVDVLHLGVVSERKGIFVDVEQETALTILRRRARQKARPARTDISVVTGAGVYKSIGACQLPMSSIAWPVPRAVGDVELIEHASASPFRLADYGYRPKIGAYVWNRDTRPKFRSFSNVPKTRKEGVVPLLWSRDIAPRDPSKLKRAGAVPGKARYVYLGDQAHTSIIKRPCVVLQRVTSNDQPRRLVAAAMPRGTFTKHGGFVGENHVVILEQESSKSVVTPTQLARLLTHEIVDRYFRCISGATNVSSFELQQLPLPNPDDLNKALKAGKPFERAVTQAYRRA